jgi:hypothetical protein
MHGLSCPLNLPRVGDLGGCYEILITQGIAIELREV